MARFDARFFRTARSPADWAPRPQFHGSRVRKHSRNPSIVSTLDRKEWIRSRGWKPEWIPESAACSGWLRDSFPDRCLAWTCKESNLPVPLGGHQKCCSGFSRMKSPHCSAMAFEQASRCLRSRALSSRPDRELSWRIPLRKVRPARIHPGQTFRSGPPATGAGSSRKRDATSSIIPTGTTRSWRAYAATRAWSQTLLINLGIPRE